MWIFVGTRATDWQLWRQDQAEPVPFLAYTLGSLSTDTHHFRQTGCSAVNGHWREQWPEDHLLHFQSYSKRFVYSVERLQHRAVDSVEVPVGWLSVDGEDWMLTQKTASPRQAAEDAVALPAAAQVIVLLQAVRSDLVARWMIFLPQVGLVIATISVFWLAYALPTWWSFLLLAVVLWVVLRDAMVQMYKKMMVYAR
ncbi:hypothetical protein LRY60_00605 [Candidatus Woesebacteria bacterium]|nr:hypothetical protein [Candidatus Woesebacteria bacterium]